MKPDYTNDPIDITAIELEARRLRAETVAKGFGALKRWIATPFHIRVTRAV